MIWGWGNGCTWAVSRVAGVGPSGPRAVTQGDAGWEGNLPIAGAGNRCGTRPGRHAAPKVSDVFGRILQEKRELRQLAVRPAEDSPAVHGEPQRTSIDLSGRKCTHERVHSPQQCSACPLALELR